MPLLLLFLIVPVLEIYVLIQVGQAIGAGWTVLLLLADALLGTWLFKREGRKAWTALNEAISAGKVPAREVADGALVVVGGAFLLTPGFLSDAFGVLCLLPPTRALLRRGLVKVVAARMLGPVAMVPGAFGRRPSKPHPVVNGEVVDGEVVEEP